MTQSVAHDFLLVLTITGLGMGIGLSFDCYRLLRRKFRPNYLSTQLSDLLFWLICVGPTFYAFYWIIEGSVRFFTILFLPVGMFLYLKFASPYIREPLYYCFLQIGRGLKLLLRLLIFCVFLFFALSQISDPGCSAEPSTTKPPPHYLLRTSPGLLRSQ
jgi:spore cortex biosynthesis protein YabQ